ncbi:MAG: putative acetyltransferase [Gammaproteobacteria bacterium]|jgi:putative acetyltransferase
MDDVSISPVTKLTEDVCRLLDQSRQYQLDIYPAESINQIDTDALLSSDLYFIGVYCESSLVGIGAFQGFREDDVFAEIKNLFIDPDYRGRGLATHLMIALQQQMKSEGYALCRLETGVRQPESIALYESCGFQMRGFYGQYSDDPLSIFMEKSLLV